MFHVRIETDNEAFENENLNNELARILRDLAEGVENYCIDCHEHRNVYPILDSNGNSVGTYFWQK